MRKRLLSMVLAVTMVLGLGVSASAANAAPKVYVDGTEFSYDTAEYGVATNLDGHIYLPLRAIAEKLGYKVGWEENRYATVEGPKGKVIVDLGNLESKSLTVGGETVTLDYKIAMAVNGRSLVAIRAFSNALDCDVAWENGAAWINKIAPGKAGSVENENMADGDNGIKNVISAEEFDPSKLEATKKLGEDLAKNFGNESSCVLTKDGEMLSLELIASDGSSYRVTVDHNGDGIVLGAGAYTNPKFWPTASKFIEQALKETVSDEIRVNTMAMLNDLAARYAADYAKAYAFTEENIADKGFPVADGYIMVIGGGGVQLKPSTATDSSNLGSKWQWYNQSNK